ncbi:cellulose synthase-like protein G3 [Tanacetum coccineum]
MKYLYERLHPNKNNYELFNTALSLMAYDYPPEKLSVYVSDDGGSKLTFFALIEAAKFAKIWLPFCRDNNVVDRCPEAYFSSHYHGQDGGFDSQDIKAIYDVMKIKVETVVERGKVYPEHISDEQQQHTFNKYRTSGFTRSNHPAIIETFRSLGRIPGLLIPWTANYKYFGDRY